MFHFFFYVLLGVAGPVRMQAWQQPGLCVAVLGVAVSCWHACVRGVPPTWNPGGCSKLGVDVRARCASETVQKLPLCRPLCRPRVR